MLIAETRKKYPMKKQFRYAAVILALILAGCGGSQQQDSSNKKTEPNAKSEIKPELPESKLRESDDSAWYSGGSLHDKSAIDWQGASSANKLATCADFVSNIWMAEKFKPQIQSSITSVESLKPYAQELVDCLDEATKAEPDSLLNSRIYTNQEVASMAAICMILMDWQE